MQVYTHDLMMAYMIVSREGFTPLEPHQFVPGNRVLYLKKNTEGFVGLLATIAEEQPNLRESVAIRPYIHEDDAVIVPRNTLIKNPFHPWCKGEPYAVVWVYSDCLVGFVNANRLLYSKRYLTREEPIEALERQVLGDWYEQRGTFTRQPLPAPNLEAPENREEEEEESTNE